jgi:HEAT repeat protein
MIDMDKRINPSGRTEVEFEIAMAVAKIGTPAMPLLNNLLDDADMRCRWFAVLALGLAGPKAVESLPKLTAMAATTDDRRFSSAIANTMARIKKE